MKPADHVRSTTTTSILLLELYYGTILVVFESFDKLLNLRKYINLYLFIIVTNGSTGRMFRDGFPVNGGYATQPGGGVLSSSDLLMEVKSARARAGRPAFAGCAVANSPPHISKACRASCRRRTNLKRARGGGQCLRVRFPELHPTPLHPNARMKCA